MMATNGIEVTLTTVSCLFIRCQMSIKGYQVIGWRVVGWRVVGWQVVGW